MVSLFPNAMAVTPAEEMTVADFMAAVRGGRWSEEIAAVRRAVAQGDQARAADLKRRLPAVTLSSCMANRAASLYQAVSMRRQSSRR